MNSYDATGQPRVAIHRAVEPQDQLLRSVTGVTYVRTHPVYLSDFCQSSCFERWNYFHHQITQNGDNLHAMDPTENRGKVCPCTYHEEVQGSGDVPPLIQNRVGTKLEWSTSSPGSFTTPPTLTQANSPRTLRVGG